MVHRQDDGQSPQIYGYLFLYGNLDRLDHSILKAARNLNVTYDALGNVTSKSDVGRHTYDATKDEVVTSSASKDYSYDANGNVINRNGSHLLRTSDDQPNWIDYGTTTVGYMRYGPDR